MNVVFTIAMLELFVGGGGRLLEVGPLTVRMLLFALCLLTSVLYAATRPKRTDGTALALGLVAAYLFIHLGGLINGIVSGSEVADMLTEMQQSLYWLGAPFIAMVLQSQLMVQRAADLVKFSGVVLAVVYLLAIAALALGIVDYLGLYAVLGESSEFSFRGESYFFYKGFLYLGIAAVFFVALDTRGSRWLAVLVIVAMVLTLTRGFVLSTSAAVLLMLMAQRRTKFLGMAALAVLAAAFVLWVYLPSIEEGLDLQRDISNLQRLDDLAFVFDRLDVKTLLIGQGLGVPIGERVNVENTFLWALWKLGLPGVLFWLSPLLLCLIYFRRINRGCSAHPLASAFVFGTVLVYVQTLSNPYLNNPIGLSYVLVSLFALRTLSRHHVVPVEVRRGSLDQIRTAAIVAA